MRLQWQRGEKHSFIALPDGPEHPRRFARLQPYWLVAGQWEWHAGYDGSNLHGMSASRQEASDAANEAYPVAMNASIRAGARSEWESHQLELIEKAKRGEIPPGFFADQAADYENLMWVMNRLKRDPPWPARVAEMIRALSDEFARRRV